MSLRGAYDVIDRRGFPRVSGDEPLCGDTTNLLAWFSPRERG